MNADDTESFSSLHPFDYEFHASQLEHFLQEYKSLQEELYRMKETAVEAPDEEKNKAKITTRPSMDPESEFRLASHTGIEGQPQSSMDNRSSFPGGEASVKSILKRKENLHRHSLSRDYTFDS